MLKFSASRENKTPRNVFCCSEKGFVLDVLTPGAPSEISQGPCLAERQGVSLTHRFSLQVVLP